jgi:hypothetical protein
MSRRCPVTTATLGSASDAVGDCGGGAGMRGERA